MLVSEIERSACFNDGYPPDDDETFGICLSDFSPQRFRKMEQPLIGYTN